MNAATRSITAGANAELAAWSDVVRDFSAAFCRVLRGAPASADPRVAAERGRVAYLLENLEPPIVAARPVQHDVCLHFEPALTLANPRDELRDALIGASLRIAGGLAWENKYAFEPGLRRLFQRFAFCDVVGPGKAWHCEWATLGFVLLGPDTLYPFHEHPARELYYVLSGHAEWAVDFEPFAIQPPGTFLLHEENQPHAMQTMDEPLLAISVWTGNIRTPSRFSTGS